MDRRILLKILGGLSVTNLSLDWVSPLIGHAAPLDAWPKSTWLASIRTLAEKKKNPAIGNETVQTPPGILAAWHPSLKAALTVALPFSGHNVSQQPNQPRILATFEKWGTKGAIIDIKEKKVIASLSSGKNKRYFGHCVFASKGDRLFVSTMDDNLNRAVLTIYSTRDFKPIAEFPTHGINAHDVQLSLKDPNTLIVANAGAYKSESKSKESEDTDQGSFLSLINSDTGQMLGRIEFGPLPNHSILHFTQSPDGWVIAGANNKLNLQSGVPVALANNPDGATKILSVPEPHLKYFLGELLSLALLGNTLVGVTCPDSGSLFIWDYAKQEFLARIQMRNPKGVMSALETGAFFVSQKSATLTSYSLTGAKPTPKRTAIRENMFNGSHLSSILRPI